MKCPNCGEEGREAKSFAGVVVCPECEKLAKFAFRRAEKQAAQLLVVIKESIRVSLLLGELRPGGEQPCLFPRSDKSEDPESSSIDSAASSAERSSSSTQQPACSSEQRSSPLPATQEQGSASAGRPDSK